jgi:hypothetical protein
MCGEEFIETLPPDLRVGARPFVFFDQPGFGGFQAIWSLRDAPTGD